MLASLYSFALSAFLAAVPAQATKPTQAATPGAAAPIPQGMREFKIRTLTVTDSNAETVQQIHVAAGVPTTLVFHTPLKAGQEAVVFGAAPDVIPEPLSNERTMLLGPERDLKPGEKVPLTLTFADGTVQTFELVTDPKTVDTKVEIVIALEVRASPDSPAALRAANAQLRAQLDECTASSAAAGVSKVAALILKQDMAKPEAFTVERADTRKLDKQSRLLVQVRAFYRLFSETYVVLTVQNRDPIKSWVLDHAEARVTGGGEGAGAQVLHTSTEVPRLPPDQEEKVVVVFRTPPRAEGQTYTLSLIENNGARHVKLEDVKL